MITAVVVNWNGRAYLEDCLRALLAQEPPPDEVILADNHSDDGSRELVAENFPQVKILDTGHNGGPGLARNAGVEAAAHRHVVLVDNDVVVRPGALRGMMAAMRAHPRAAAVQARALCHDRPDVVHYDWADLHFLGLLLQRNFYVPLAMARTPTGPVHGAVGLCLLVDRERYLAIGGSHERLFFYFEDTELVWRLQLAGHEVWLAADAHVLHRGGTAGLSLRDGAVPSRRTYYHARNRWAVLLTCLHWRSLLLLLPAQVVYTGAHLAFAISKGQLLAWLRGAGAFVGLLPDVVRWRAAAQRGRRARDRDLLAADPLTLNPGLADRGVQAHVRRLLDRFYGFYWRLVRPLCG